MSIEDTVVLPTQTKSLNGGGRTYVSPEVHPLRHTIPTVSVAVVEASGLLRTCIAGCVAKYRRFQVAGYASLEELIAHNSFHRHSLVIFHSLATRHHATLRDIERLKNMGSSCRIVVLTDTDDQAFVDSFLQHGARGVIPTTFPASTVAEALNLVFTGATFNPFENVFARGEDGMQPAASGNCGLTKREGQIVSLLRSGKPNKQIAYELGLSIGTVKVHLHNIMNKLGARNRIQVLACQGLISADHRAGTGRAPSMAGGRRTIADLIDAATGEAYSLK